MLTLEQSLDAKLKEGDKIGCQKEATHLGNHFSQFGHVKRTTHESGQILERINSSPVAAVLLVDSDTFGLTIEVAYLSHFLMVILCSWCPGGWKVSVLSDDNFTINKYKRHHQEKYKTIYCLLKII